MAVRFGIPPTDIRPGFHAARRSAGKILKDAVDGGAAGTSSAKRVVSDPAHEGIRWPFVALSPVVGLQWLLTRSVAVAAAAAPTTPQMTIAVSFARPPSLADARQYSLRDLNSNSVTCDPPSNNREAARELLSRN